jgi:hypothetical protein
LGFKNILYFLCKKNSENFSTSISQRWTYVYRKFWTNLVKNFCLKKNFANVSALQIPEGQQHLSKQNPNITYVSSLQFLYNLKSPKNGVEISLLANY